MKRTTGGTLDSHHTEFDERNLLLQLALGLIAAAKRLDAILAQHGRSSAAEKRAAAPGDEVLVDFLLGVIAFRNRVMGHLESSRTPVKPRAPAPAKTPFPEDLRR
jgi:hypothetical protein